MKKKGIVIKFPHPPVSRNTAAQAYGIGSKSAA